MCPHRPRRGSVAYWPRIRARSIVARIRNWPSPDLDKPTLLGFAGYKVGMMHVVAVEDRKGSPLFGREVVKAATVIETPPLKVVGFRAYMATPYGLRTLGEVWVSEPPKYLDRVFTVPEKFNTEEQLKKIKSSLNVISELRAIVSTQPKLSGLGKKTPEVFEIKVHGGSLQEQFDYLVNLLGKEIRVSNIFSEGDYVDVISITKGKGTQGPVKRFGIKIAPRWHKHRKGSRGHGTRGPQHPGPMFTSPQAGQMGFHQRTEYNKRILKIGHNGEDINPSGGWKHYGIVRSDYVVIEGSVPGPIKRLIKLRFPIRPREVEHSGKPQILYMSIKPIEVT